MQKLLNESHQQWIRPARSILQQWILLAVWCYSFYLLLGWRRNTRRGGLKTRSAGINKNPLELINVNRMIWRSSSSVGGVGSSNISGSTHASSNTYSSAAAIGRYHIQGAGPRSNTSLLRFSHLSHSTSPFSLCEKPEANSCFGPGYLIPDEKRQDLIADALAVSNNKRKGATPFPDQLQVEIPLSENRKGSDSERRFPHMILDDIYARLVEFGGYKLTRQFVAVGGIDRPIDWADEVMVRHFLPEYSNSGGSGNGGGNGNTNPNPNTNSASTSGGGSSGATSDAKRFDPGVKGVIFNINPFDPEEALFGAKEDVVKQIVGAVAPEEVVPHLKKNGMMPEKEGGKAIDTLKLDLDSWECEILEHVLKGGYRPTVILTESNSVWPPPIAYRRRYAADKYANKKLYTGGTGRDAHGSNAECGRGMDLMKSCSLQAVMDVVNEFSNNDYVLVQYTLEDAWLVRRK